MTSFWKKDNKYDNIVERKKKVEFSGGKERCAYFLESGEMIVEWNGSAEQNKRSSKNDRTKLKAKGTLKRGKQLDRDKKNK